MRIEELLKKMDMEFLSTSLKISPSKFFELWKEGKGVLLDVRTKEEQEFIAVKDSLKIPLDELPDRLDEIPRDKLVAIFCPGRIRASIAYTYLSLQGFNVKVLVATYDDIGSLVRP